MLCHDIHLFSGVNNGELHGALKYANLRPEIPADTSDILRNIMTKCWQFEPADRPGMEDIVNMLLEDFRRGGLS